MNQSQQQSEDKPKGSNRRLRVLVIGDNPEFILTLKAFLAQFHKYEVANHSRTGWDGLKMAGEFKPEVVIIDFSMKDMTGAAVTKALKAHPSPPVVIVVSKHDSTDYAEISRHAGADAYVLKSNLSSIPKIVQDAIEARRGPTDIEGGPP